MITDDDNVVEILVMEGLEGGLWICFGIVYVEVGVVAVFKYVCDFGGFVSVVVWEFILEGCEN